jgi:predicted ArsR family transcriptional regulator
MTIPTARQRVLAYLKKHQAVSAAQIGRGLKMSPAAVRYHLGVLCSDDRAVQVGLTRKDGRGRPVKLFGISQNLLGNNLALLSDLLLTQRLAKLPASQREKALFALAEGLMAEMDHSAFDAPMSKRLALVMKKLNELNYQARWEAGPEGPRILFGRCPYAAIIKNHPELCAMDAALLEGLMGRSARQSAKIGVEGSQTCIFHSG